MKKARYVIDADVAIDITKVEVAVFKFFTALFGKILMPEIVFGEIKTLTKKDCKLLGIEIYDPKFSETVEAESLVGANSLADCTAFVVAKSHNLCLITNDGRLIKRCEAANVPFKRGLRVLLDLVEKKALKEARTIKIATKIHEINPRYVTKDILNEFLQQLSAMRARR